MGAQRPQFGSHRFVKRLTEAGLSEEVAEVLADEHAELSVSGGVATKTDLDAIRAEMATRPELAAVRAEMATKEELAAVRAEMATKSDLELVRAEMATKSELAAIRAELAAVRAEMATKEELAAVRADLVAVRAEMATKSDLRQEIDASEARIEQRLRNEILEARVSITKWMITTMMVFSGVVIAAMTALR